MKKGKLCPPYQIYVNGDYFVHKVVQRSLTFPTYFWTSHTIICGSKISVKVQE